jgi:hypothetical protein
LNDKKKIHSERTSGGIICKLLQPMKLGELQGGGAPCIIFDILEA